MKPRVSETLRFGAARLAEAGIDAGDARHLLAFALGVSRDRLVLMGGDAMPSEAAARFDEALTRRIAHEPVSKIVGTRAFWGREFRVTPDVLDPRPETETLIAEALAGPAPTRFLDLGTGSGCIALTLLAEWPQARGVACDLSAAALNVAAENARSLGVEGQVDLRRSDWFGAVDGVFDLIVSNPPYITAQEMTELSPEVLGHDPHMALTPGGDGLEPYRVIARDGAAYLAPEGRVLVEIGWKQGPDVAALFAQNGWREIRVLPDLDGRDRVVAAIRG
ncbi:peptide chain release factor N(5)-glutamine methyltransferase [Thalassobius vesicularis]|uniref:Release factor glutamine methyltransferase n=1 Tax=Thalassobius vesicularis TaxID=1294297 RepID=A0A4S3MAW1_9RHOB|nr:peptide chain release factor N(5)-glutamine methyltransferase [Thalassobius vesicularis]THD73473.1 peptide chain release factor N(5)-glutamine methyltransferase [Thalassobius vesicularis]